MDFCTSNGLERPVRLCHSTRLFAYESLHYKYGSDTLRNDAVTLDDIPDFEKMSKLERYNAAVARIAQKAPIRICEGERISGAATLGAAIKHVVPASYCGKYISGSISHLTVDFESVLKYGIVSLSEQAERSLAIFSGTEREPFVRSCVHCLDCFKVWHKRYLDTLKDLPQYAANYKNLQRVPMQPATNFYEAVQSIWFTFAFLRLCGNWPGIGRIDWLLGRYLAADLRDQKITLKEAREILAHFFIKGCEWVAGGNYGSGDAQHYQNILLCGVDESGLEVTNDVTYLVLDILEELGISDFPTSVRLSRNTDEALLRRVAEVMRYGGGILAVYNEDLIIDSLVSYGYPLKEARCFANDGCWEVQIPGRTNFGYIPFDSLAILQKNTLGNYEPTVNYTNFDSLYNQYISDLRGVIDVICNRNKEFCWTPQEPCTVVSLFEGSCIENGLSYLEGGAKYNVRSPHIGGLADTVNCLYAIKKLVFDENKCSFAQMLAILRSNWEGEETLRQYMLNHFSYYGNDNDEVDSLAARLLNDFADCCDNTSVSYGYSYPAGVSTFGRQLEWAPQRLAAAHGRKAGEVLAANCSPTPGTDIVGATGIIRSYCKCPLQRMITGAALDIKLFPGAVSGKDGLQALMGLMRGFVTLGGHFMQPDIIDAGILQDAQVHPEEYQTLSVRVSGWNARFVTLSKEWQDMIIAQNKNE